MLLREALDDIGDAGLRRAAPPRPAAGAARAPARRGAGRRTATPRRPGRCAGSARRSPARSTWIACSRWPARRRRSPARPGRRPPGPPVAARRRWSRSPAAPAAPTPTRRPPSCSRAAGAQVVAVDPLRDEALPAGTRALVVGGALPESYARGAVRQPAALHRGRRVGPHRMAGARRGHRAAVAGPRVRRAGRCAGCWTRRGEPGPAGGRLPRGDRPGRHAWSPVRARGWSGYKQHRRGAHPAGRAAGRLELGRAARRRVSSGAACTPPSSACTGRRTPRSRPGW